MIFCIHKWKLLSLCLIRLHRWKNTTVFLPDIHAEIVTDCISTTFCARCGKFKNRIHLVYRGNRMVEL